jgi:hypothetical protein
MIFDCERAKEALLPVSGVLPARSVGDSRMIETGRQNALAGGPVSTSSAVHAV